MSMRHEVRRERLRSLMADRLPGRALVVTDLANVRYLTGFSGSNGILLVSPDGTDVLGTDGRYRDQAAEQAAGVRILVDRDTLSVVMAELGSRPGAIESYLPVGDADSLRAAGRDVVVAPPLVEELRVSKDVDELDALARACSITVAAFAALQGEMRVGASELALARRLEQLFGEFGAEDRAFETIVGGGPHSAIPHHEPGDRRLALGDLVVVDAGARVDGYHADMTRTFIVGDAPAPWQIEIHELVRQAQAAATAGYLPGADRRGVDALARDLIAEAGYGDAFAHGLGHGVGLRIHEAPTVGARATGTLEATMAITVEPGVYLTGRGGVRIEDTLVVTDTGPRILTEAPRDLVVVG
jgi:Xaa-Pro aminopeptidase